MAAEFWRAFALGLALVLAGATALEAVLTPRPRLARPAAAWAAHFGICLLAYALELALFQRAVFGAAMALATLALLVAVSEVKTRMLREPFLFQDFEYFTDLIRHPRLYLPFFGVWNALAGLAAFAGLVCAGIALEQSLPARGGLGPYLAALALTALAGAGLLRAGREPPWPLSFDPAADLRGLGFLPCLWWYGLAERRPIPGLANSPFLADPPAGAARPDLVVVQSESFFDPRRLHPGIAPAATAAFDRARREAWRHGLLEVPAWGANTVRSEFAFLSGLAPEDLGVHRFNPYRRLGGAAVPTLASHLRKLGYRTVCVHPYHAAFYRRDQVYPLLGFDEFIDLAAFSEADRFGPYVGDVAAGRKIRSLLREADGPLFVFAITMENHGPLHWETPTPADESRLYQTPPPAGFDDLTVYLRHLENAGRMLEEVQAALAESPREGWLCWYGDHVPIMPAVYAAAGFGDGRTDYFIWKAGGAQEKCQPMPAAAEKLSACLLEEANMARRPETADNPSGLSCGPN